MTLITFAQTYSKELVSLLVPFLAAISTVLLQARVRLVFGRYGQVLHLVPPAGAPTAGAQTTTVASITYFIQNQGRQTAESVEVVFNFQPPQLYVWPQRDYEAKTNPGGRYVLVFPNLSHKEFVGIEVMSIGSPLPELVHVRSKQGGARQVQMTPMQIQPRWKFVLATYLLFAGLLATVYITISAIQYFARIL